MPDRKRTQPDQTHGEMPPDFQKDLTPDFQGGENHGLAGPHPELRARTAYDIKVINQQFDELSDDMLKQIPIIPAGTRLEQGATYVDLHEPNRQEFKARASMIAGPDNWYVLKSSVGYILWNTLMGVTNPARLDEDDMPPPSAEFPGTY